jgi:methyl-accepting chemotaxis protein
MSNHDQHSEATEEQLKPYYNKVYLQADSIARYFMIGFFAFGILLSFFHDTYLIAIIMGGSSLAVFFMIQTFIPDSQFLRYATSFLFWNFGVQYLFQMKGLSEMHFVFFIALTVLLFYEDWKLLLPATIYAILTHVVFYAYGDVGLLSTHLPEAQNTTTTSFILHMSLLLTYAALCLRWSMMQRDQTHESAIRAITMERQLTMMNTNIMFADSISQGNLNVDYPSSQTDRLGQSLLNMRSSLAEATKREERERFSTSGLAKIGDILRQHANSLELLCDHVLEEIVKYMKANQGAIFMIEEKDTTNVHLKLMACRAWDRKKYLQKNVTLGEGLIGQAAIEKQTIFMTKVPNNYITISSGLGQANPACVLIVPLKSEDEVVGIIELASFKAFRDYEIAFLEKVGESIASTMITTQNNQRNKELLEKSHALTEQMRAQEEEIRQNMEEMQASQEEMVRKEKEINRLLEDSRRNEQLLKDKMEEVKKMEEADKLKTEKMLAELEQNRKIMTRVIEELPEKIFLKDEAGRMLLLNSAIASGYNKSVDELIGKSDFDLFPKEVAQGFREIEEEIISSGKPLTLYEDFPDANGEVRNLYTVKMPFRFPDSSKIGILGYQVDITEIRGMENKVKESERIMRKKEEEAMHYMKNYQRTLLDVLDQLPHKIFLKDESGKMVLVNTVVAKAHGMSIDELIGKSDFDFVDAKTAQDWRNQELEIIKKGSETYIFNENLHGEEKTLKSTKMAFFIHHLNQTGLLGVQTDITELQSLKAQLDFKKGK